MRALWDISQGYEDDGGDADDPVSAHPEEDECSHEG